MLAFADCHQAQQLKNYCLHFVAQGLGFLSSDFPIPNARVQAEVQHYVEGLSQRNVRNRWCGVGCDFHTFDMCAVSN